MQYTVKRTCGHSTNENLFGKSSERDARLAWLKGQPCLACKRGAETAKAHTETAGLPALVGTEKQVAWATRIRAEKLAAIEADLAQMERTTGQTRPTTIAIAFARLQTETNAAGWIDRRDLAPRALLQQAVA